MLTFNGEFLLAVLSVYKKVLRLPDKHSSGLKHGTNTLEYATSCYREIMLSLSISIASSNEAKIAARSFNFVP